jgi:hypothetical protein
MIHQSVQKKDIMGDKTVRVRAELAPYHKIETTKEWRKRKKKLWK